MPINVSGLPHVIEYGLRELLAPYEERVCFDNGGSGSTDHIRMVDPYSDEQQFRVLALVGRGGPLVCYTNRPAPRLGAVTRRSYGDLRGWLTMGMPTRYLVDALERIDAGETVIGGVARAHSRVPAPSNLSSRELEVMLLISAGLANSEIAESYHLSLNTIKSYIRSAYRKIGITSRREAVLWGVAHGLRSQGEGLSNSSDTCGADS